ncbi:MAG: hypothetical protein GYA24_10915 [Candidatus Lokiarchaeota archaeon]|nr:hypothetical protein [Candidatus Lokiarchaeota archaeon]
MTNGETHAETPTTLYSLPVAAPALVLRAGELLKAAGNPLAVIELYETFIAGLRSHELTPLPIGPAGGGTDDHAVAANPLLGFLPVRNHPERYTLA